MKRSLLALAGVVAVTLPSRGAHVEFSNFDLVGARGWPIALENGATVPRFSGAISIGTFRTLTDFQIREMGPAGRTALLADFMAFANSVNNPATTGDPIASELPGMYSKLLSEPMTAGDPRIGESIYTFIGNGSTLHTSDQIAVVKDDDTFIVDTPPALANAYIHDRATSTLVIGSEGPPADIPGLGTFPTLRLATGPGFFPERLVTTTADSGAGSLRHAIATANALDRIVFAPAAWGVFVTSELVIAKPLIIAGPGATELAISGSTLSRVFRIAPGAEMIIHGLTIRNGQTVGAHSSQPGIDGQPAAGGAIYNDGSLALFDCMINDNKCLGGRGGNGQIGGPAVNPGHGGEARGGAIYNTGILMLTRCTLLGNFARGGHGGDGGRDQFSGTYGNGGSGNSAYGGAIWSNSGTVRLENCTFTNNHATGGNGGLPWPLSPTPVFGSGAHGIGGALSGLFALDSCTITENSANGGVSQDPDKWGQGLGGGARSEFQVGSQFQIQSSAFNSIIARNAVSGNEFSGAPDAAEFATPWLSLGWNIIGITDGSSGWTANDLTGNNAAPLNPMLGFCLPSGASIWTMCPLAGSPARDQGKSTLATDARRGRRVVDYAGAANASGGNGADIGAVELDSLLDAPTMDKTGPVLRVTFRTESANIYQLQVSDALIGSWSNITSLRSNAPSAEAVDPAAFALRRFYRVNSSPAPAFAQGPNGPGASLCFDGNEDYVGAAPPALPTGNSPYTIEAWISPRFMHVGGIVAWGNYGFPNQVNAFVMDSTGLVNYWWGNDLSAPTTDLSDGWHHVAASFDGTTRRIFLDGVIVASDTPVGHNAAPSNFRVGLANAGQYFDGRIDEVRVWNIARLPAQILEAMRRQLIGNESGLVAYYRFDDGAGLVATDSASAGRYATLVHDPEWNSEDLFVGIRPFSPTVRTYAATAVGSTTATLNGAADPGSSGTTAWFEWGSTINLGNATAAQPLGNSTGWVIAFSSSITGLTPGITYYYRAVASNAHGLSRGELQVFH